VKTTRLAVAIAVLVAGCTDPGAEPWELAHDRVIAVRATPPHLPAGAAATIDLLVTSVVDGPSAAPPVQVVAAPDTVAPLAGAVRGAQVIAPDEAALDAAREALALEPGAPVPLRIVATAALGDKLLVATKTVWLGDAADNPTIDEVRVGETMTTTTADAPIGDIELEVAADDADEVDWLTSLGELSDFDDPLAHLDVTEPGDATIAVVRRDDRGGVAWRILAIAVH